jgi:hypothetical protein
MYNKKGAMPAEEIRGILTFVFTAAIILLLYYGCSVRREQQEYDKFELVKNEFEAIKELNLFLEMPVDEERKVMDLAVESYLNEDYAEFDRVTQKHFSDIYDDWRLILFIERETVYESGAASAVRIVDKFGMAEVYLPVLKEGAEEFKFIRIILYVYE